MLKLYVKATDLLDRLSANKKGVVSFEYVIVASCIVLSVLAAFGSGTGGKITTALQGAIDGIVANLPSA
jgi:hypothetical protein